MRGDRQLSEEEIARRLAATRVRLPPDRETAEWLEHHRRPHGALMTALHRAMRRLASDFDVDALLGMHPMHLLGTASWRALLGSDRIGGLLLDVGAGAGDVTLTLAPLFDAVVATETSSAMVRRLQRRGIEALRLDLATAPVKHLRARGVALLNVLDRCARPRTLLRAALEHLEPGGVVLIATPLPFRPHVDLGPHTADPDELVVIHGQSFEEQLGSFVGEVIVPANLSIRAWTATTYHARGDATTARYALDAAVLACRPRVVS